MKLRRRRSKMDWTTLTFSILALLISAGGFYFDRVRILDDLRVVTAYHEAYGIAIDEDGKKADVGKLDITLLYTNLGTQQVAVSQIKVVLAFPFVERRCSGYLSNETVGFFDLDVAPFLVRPSEIEVRHLQSDVGIKISLPENLDTSQTSYAELCLLHQIITSDSDMIFKTSFLESGTISNKKIV